MGDIVDVRPDRFLRALREHGKWKDACEQSGLDPSEIEELCAARPAFDLASLECQLEHIEEALIKHTEMVIDAARVARDARIAQIRVQAMAQFRLRRSQEDEA